jgi:hypothetical protein
VVVRCGAPVRSARRIGEEDPLISAAVQA